MTADRYAATRDFYETPAWAVRAIVPHLPCSRGVLDPCAGKGAILQVLEHEAEGRFTALRGIEINEAYRHTHGFPTLYGDALDPAVSWGAPRLVVMNPPFHVAQEILVRALDEVRPGGTIAALLRLSFLASTKRLPFHRAHPSDVYVLADRPSFCVTITCSKRDCGWRVMLAVDVARPRKCGSCSGEVRTSTTDASEYMWLIFGPGRGSRWQVLTSPPEVT